ncbi:putative pilus assembly protein FilE [Acinetobacter celticus]
MLQVSTSNAGTFHTIIGPDGRPMVVQMPDSPTAKKSVNQPLEPIKQLQINPVETKSIEVIPHDVLPKSTPPLNPQQEQKVQKVVHDLESRLHENTYIPVVQKSSPNLQKISIQPEQLEASKTLATQTVKPAFDKRAMQTAPQTFIESDVAVKQIPVANLPKAMVSAPLHSIDTLKPEVQKKSASLLNVVPQTLLKKPAEAVQQTSLNTTQPTGFSAINGEQYVNSEYLEDKEFNLDGKKRFYAMPEGVIDTKIGSTRMQMVEREKGVSKSMIESIFKSNRSIEKGPVTLSTSYYRVSKDEAVTGLGQRCFQDKQIKKAKSLKAQSEVNVWPRPPLNDEFDFDVVKIDHSIQNIQINSYASKQNNPTFYWPFVVFLDEQGCVLEGAGGYKNNDSGADSLYRERIEGVIQVPKKTEYILLTPLATAIDVEQRALTNYGQLKLIAIR